MEGQIVFNRQDEKITERNNLNFRQSGYSIARLAVNLIKNFSFDYMHLVCLGVVHRMLHYFKRCYKGINSHKF